MSSLDQPELDIAPREIPITDPDTLLRIGRLWGLAKAEDALEKGKCSLPGFALASALVGKALAEQKAELIRLYYRLAARHGVDVGSASRFELVDLRTLRITFGDDEGA